MLRAQTHSATRRLRAGERSGAVAHARTRRQDRLEHVRVRFAQTEARRGTPMTCSLPWSLYESVPLKGAIRLLDVEPRRLRTGRWFRRLGRVIARVNPWRIHISGGENLNRNRAYVIVSNHQSLADIPVISHLKLDTKWLAKAELFRLRWEITGISARD